MLSLRLLISLALVATAFASPVEPLDEPVDVPADDAAPVVPSGRGVGEICGNGTQGSSCRGHLVCFKPSVGRMGSPGYCVSPLAKDGESCEGAIGPDDRTYCGRGLFCQKTSAAIGGQGKCRPYLEAGKNGYANVGEACGGGRQDSKNCGPNARCDRPSRPGAQGKCVEVKHNVGQYCGGGTRYPFSCEEGLRCAIPINIVGALGYCVKQ